MIVSCKQCHHDFHATTHQRAFCSRKCKDAYFRRVDLEKLAQLASNGDKASYMAMVLGVSPPTITRALRTHGLYGTWQTMRYA